MDAGDVYVAPSDWPPSNNVLRMPQVVWLNAVLPNIYSESNPDPTLQGTFEFKVFFYGSVLGAWVISNAYTIGDGSTVTISGTGNSESHLVYTYFDYDGTQINVDMGGSPPPAFAEDAVPPDGWYGFYYHTITNPYVAEYARLQSIFTTVKLLIETLREGKTWVEIVLPTLPPPVPFPPGHWPLYYFQTQLVPYYWHMVAPKDRGQYLGTDFLHLYVGILCKTFQAPAHQTLAAFNPSSLDSTFTTSYANLSLVDPPTPTSSPERFRRYAVKIWGLAIEYDEFPDHELQVYSRPTQPADVEVTRKDMSGNPESFFVPWTLDGPQSTYDATMASQHSTRQNAVNTQNTANLEINDSSNELLEAHCTYLASKGFNYIYMGTQDLIANAAYLVNLIAAHFKFNADTGADLEPLNLSSIF
jgi:hypothetical protein